MIKQKYRFSGEEGFHARPVTEFVQVAKQFSSNVEIEYEGETYDGKSSISIMCSCIEDGCVFSLIIDGADEQQARLAIREKMMHSPEAYFVEVAADEKCSNAGSSKDASAKGKSEGCIAVSSGVAIGKAQLYRRNDVGDIQTTENTDSELQKLETAISSLAKRLKESIAGIVNEDSLGIVEAHAEILKDASLIDLIKDKITTDKLGCVSAITVASEEMQKRFEALKNERMRERAADIKDVLNQLASEITGVRNNLEVKGKDTIIIAEELLPSDTIHLDPDMTVGFITEKGGSNCHSSIVARGLGIPALSNVKDALSIIPNEAVVIIDGDEGVYYVSPSEELLQKYRAKVQDNIQKQQENEKYRSLASQTVDGKKIELAANIFDAAEMGAAVQAGAEGVGLFRTEFLYMNREQPPTLEEQFECYKKTLVDANGLPVTIRTLDAGGDKPTPCLNMPKEDNPFLGVRAIRFCLKNPDIFRTQLRALLMASAYGNLRIMFPMITMQEELVQVLKILNAEKQYLVAEGIALGNYQTGIMIETPAAAIMSKDLAPLVDFFSIGTNDLTQYVMAADRGSGELSDFQSPYQPAVLRLINYVVKSASMHSVWVGICGESGGDQLLTPLFIGMGISELSMTAKKIPLLRSIVNSLAYEALAQKVELVINSPTAVELKERLINLHR
ncbi:MAG TPA: phosphoenolpyruvate--protein phosphotransferase [Firmicutes bacterium]|jgi:phosphotransferase system enzyme I (PtsI)|nr:phosphoenolpyruvate--protein phosphotransferase [Bacillota bacterium]